MIHAQQNPSEQDQPEVPSAAPFRHLYLRLPNPRTPAANAVTFDVESFAATLKRSHVEAVTVLASDVQNKRFHARQDAELESLDGDLPDRLVSACRNQGLAAKYVVSTGQEAGNPITAFPSRPALEAACYHRLCKGNPIALEDRLSPDGTFDAEAYTWLGAVYGEIALKERWCRGVQSLAEIGIVSSIPRTESRLGAARLVQAGKYAFNMLEEEEDFTPYRVLILPEDVSARFRDGELNARLQAYLQQGGKLLAAFEFASALKETFLQEILTETSLVSDAVNIATDTNTVTLQNGNIVFLSQPHFRAYAQSAGKRHMRAVLDALKLLLPDPLLRHDGPGTLEATVTEQAERNRWVLHLMHYLPMDFAFDSLVYDDIIPLNEVKISLKTPEPVVRVELRPQYHDELDFWEHQGRIEFVVPKIVGHCMVVIEFAK